jgi:hypothetical protein
MQPLVERAAAGLPTWKAKLMTKAGRATMVKAVISAIPIHQQLVLAPPKKTLKLIDKIKRGFLWEGKREAKGGNCHVNWKRVCRPLAYGGLGIPDIERTGLALRLRWLWLTRTDSRRAWRDLDLQFSAEERAIFFASTNMVIGNGQQALFWEDRWIDGRAAREIAPALFDCIPKRRRKIRTVAQGLQGNSWARDIHGILGVHEIGQYLQLWMAIAHTTLTTEPDRLVWKWTDSGSYTAKSCYLALFQGSTMSSSWKLTWKTWGPPRVKFFSWLASMDRCWTAERLARRGLQHHPRCLLCDQLPETMHHLILACPFSRQVWHEVLARLRMTCQPPTDADATLDDWWRRARQGTPKIMRKGLDSITLLTPWLIWKHHNACVFDRSQPSVFGLVDDIMEEAVQWARARAKGLRVVLPTTWDVH